MKTYIYRGYTREKILTGGYIDAISRKSAIEQIKEKNSIMLITYFKSVSNIFKSPKLQIHDVNTKVQNSLLQRSIKREEAKEATNKKRKQNKKDRNSLGESEKNTSKSDNSKKQDNLETKSIYNDNMGDVEFINPNITLQANSEEVATFFQTKKTQDEFVKPVLRQKKTKKKKTTEKTVDWNLIEKNDLTYDVKKNNKLRISEKEIILFTRKLSMMLSSGVSIVNSLTVLSEEQNKDMNFMVSAIIEDIQVGNSFSYAISKYPKQFDSHYVAMVSIGESSGSIQKCLNDIIEYKEKVMSVKKKMKTAIIYPKILTGLLVAVIFFSSFFLIPEFEKMFSEQDVVLPSFTLAVFSIANNIPIIFIVIVVVAIGIKLACKNSKTFNRYFQSLIDRVALSFPVVKDIVITSSMFSFTSTISLMLKNGIKLSDCLNLAQRAVGNLYIKNDINNINELMMQGFTFSEALKEQTFFDRTLDSVVVAGEESGTMESSLNEASVYFNDELTQKVNDLSELVQPISLITISLAIVPVIIAIYLPILDLSSGALM